MIEVVEDDMEQGETDGHQDEAAPDRDDILDGLERLEGSIRDAIVARAAKPGGFPDQAANFAMEEPLNQLFGAVVLFRDLVTAIDGPGDVRPAGLVFLSAVMCRDVERLYRLYSGRAPNYYE